MNDNFSELKERILASARIAQACREQYGRAYSSETPEELMEVIKDNFHWCVGNEVLTVPLIEEYKGLFSEHGIHCNESVDSGYLLADNATVLASDNATVLASDNATVEASGNATVRASGNATVRASDNATVRASGNATVRASGNAYITSYNTIERQLSDKAIYRIRETNTIRFVSEKLKFEKIYENRAAK